MSWGGPEFMVAIVGISTVGWLVNNYLRARHGYALEDEWGGKTLPAQSDASRQLAAENAELREQLAHFSDRVKVLERIVTDKGYDVASRIEALRDARAVEAVKLEGDTRQ